MPSQRWKHDCPGTGQVTFSGRPETCPACSGRATYDGWGYGMIEGMARYAQFYGLAPIGQHRRSADEILRTAVTPCPLCDGRGLVDDPMTAAAYGDCGACRGFGRLYRLPREEFLALRQRVLDASPWHGKPDWTPPGRTEEEARDFLRRAGIEPGAPSPDASPGGREASAPPGPEDETAPQRGTTAEDEESEGESEQESEEESHEEPEEESEEKPGDPWRDVTAVDLQAYLDERLEEDTEAECETGKVLRPTREVRVEDAVLAVVRGGAAWQDAAHERLADDGVLGVVARISGSEPAWVVLCSTTSSMVSGCWGLMELRLGTRGFLCHRPDDQGDTLEITGAWDPVDDDVARRACVLQGFGRTWFDHTLPPAMGEWADGDAELLQAAISNVLARSPHEWASVVERIEEGGELGRATIDQAARLSGATTTRVGRVACRIARDSEDVLDGLVAGSPGDELWRVVLALFVCCIATSPLDPSSG